MKDFLSYFKNLIVTLIEFSIYFALLSFIEWNLDIAQWSSLSRLAYILLIIYSSYKNDEK